MNHTELTLQGLLHCDAAGASAVSQALTVAFNKAVSPSVMKAEATDVFPVEGAGHSATAAVEVSDWSTYGGAKIIGYGATDLPKNDTGRAPKIHQLKQIASYFEVSTLELEQSLRNGTPLQTKKMEAATRAHAMEVDRIVWGGDAAHGITGVKDYGFAQVALKADGRGNSAKAEAKTAVQIARDLRSLVAGVFNQTQGQRKADLLVLAADLYELAAGTMVDASGKSALALFMENNPGVRVIASYGLKATAEIDAMALASGSSTASIWLPVYAQALPEQARGLMLVTPVETRTAGLVVSDSKAITIAKGAL